MPAFVAGYSRASASDAAASDARTAPSVVSSSMRATTLSARARRRSVAMPGIAASGSQMSVTLGNRNGSRITPTIVAGAPFTRTDRPTTDGSAP